MADDNYKDTYRVVTRVIEYRGPQDWIESTLASSRIPIQGTKQFPNGVYIKSGVIMWQPDVVTEDQVNETEARETVKTVPFKRPGE